MSVNISVKNEQDMIVVSVGNIKAILTPKQAEILYVLLYKKLAEQKQIIIKEFEGQEWD